MTLIFSRRCCVVIVKDIRMFTIIKKKEQTQSSRLFNLMCFMNFYLVFSSCFIIVFVTLSCYYEVENYININSEFNCLNRIIII